MDDSYEGDPIPEAVRRYEYSSLNVGEQDVACLARSSSKRLRLGTSIHDEVHRIC